MVRRLAVKRPKRTVAVSERLLSVLYQTLSLMTTRRLSLLCAAIVKVALFRLHMVIREIRVIRGQPLLAKLDDLSHRILGARMAMLNVLMLGNEQPEVTTDVSDNTDSYRFNASRGSRADGAQRIALSGSFAAPRLLSSNTSPPRLTPWATFSRCSATH